MIPGLLIMAFTCHFKKVSYILYHEFIATVWLVNSDIFAVQYTMRNVNFYFHQYLPDDQINNATYYS